MILLDIEPHEHYPTQLTIGNKYHISWARERGMVWKLITYNQATDIAMLQTPKTKKYITAKGKDLRLLNKDILANRRANKQH